MKVDLYPDEIQMLQRHAQQQYLERVTAGDGRGDPERAFWATLVDKLSEH